ncbi:hypothetical protein HDV01_000012 [Terramyces sp. JEL0728]|nr:hypothetical protein HDV01_000012 [Terramyces sp. JEL0728]
MITTKNILDIAFNMVNIGIAGASSYLMYKLNYRKAHVKSFKKRFNIVLGINLIQCCMFLYIFFMSYFDSNLSTMFYFSETVSLISNIEICFIILIDIEILRIYSVLNSRITNRKIDMFRNAVVGIFILFPFTSHVLFLALRSTFTAMIGNVCIALFSLFVVVYDNLQNIYLATLIYKFKNVKCNNELTEEMMVKFKEITKYNIAIVLLDWTAIAFYAIFIISPGKSAESHLGTYSNFASIFCICLHSLGLVVILKMLKDFAVSKKPKRRAKVVEDANTTQQILNPPPPPEANQSDTQILSL